jgi:hypothetical protein
MCLLRNVYVMLHLVWQTLLLLLVGCVQWKSHLYAIHLSIFGHSVMLRIAAVCVLPWLFSFSYVFDGWCPCHSICRSLQLTQVLQQVISSVTTFGTVFCCHYWSCYNEYINECFMARWWLQLLLNLMVSGLILTDVWKYTSNIASVLQGLAVLPASVT